MERKKSLLEKYEMPINHLDFAYIKTCEDAIHMEKIVHILRSNQEGYFPDLTKCAEDKLKELKPNSKLFRYEEQLQKRDCLDAKELKPIYDWNQDIKFKDNELAKLCKDVTPLGSLPPLRKCGKIAAEKSTAEETKNPVATKASDNSKEHRIKSTDYGKWDKYDPDVEILRMDLEEERNKEEIERKNRKNAMQKSDETPKIIEITDEEASRIECEQNEKKLLEKLSQVEREKYAEERRLYGNEYFRAKEYENAIKEYSRAIHFDPANASRAYNNRAVAYIQIKDYLSAIEDCEQCLKVEPNNVKALLRLADAYYAYGRRRDSYDEYLKVLALAPSNTFALKAVDKLCAEFGELPPGNATRMIITEEKSEKETKTEQNQTKTTPHKKPKQIMAPPKEYDLAELVKPNRVVKSKLTSAAEALGTITNMAKATHKDSQHQVSANQIQKPQQNLKPTSAFEELRLPTTNTKPKEKVLIQEM